MPPPGSVVFSQDGVFVEPRKAGKPLPYQTTDVSERVSVKTMSSLPSADPSRSLLQDTSPQKKMDWSNIRDSTDDQNLDMRDDPTVAAHRTAARTGTTFDIADLITNGTATKLPGMFLPSEHPAMQVIGLNEATMPGDVLGVSPRHPPVTQPIEERMAQIIRERSLDLVGLMDDFLKRPAYSRMPTRNRAFLDVGTFRRAMCYAMGDQWTRLAMTTAEFKSVCIKHLRTDASHGSQAQDVQGYGQPEPLILWQPFAYGIMQMADGDKYKLKLRGELSGEQRALYEQQRADAKAAEAAYGKHAGLDIGCSQYGTMTSNTLEAQEGLREKQRAKGREDMKPIGSRGARVGEVNYARTTIRDRLLMKNATVRKALKDLDESGDGVIDRDEIKKFLREQYLLKYFDFYTGQTRGDLDPKVIDTLLDMVDADGNGSINYTEFSEEIMKGAN